MDGGAWWAAVHGVAESWTLESPLDCKEIQPVHSEGDQPWDFFGRTDAEAETPSPLQYSCLENPWTEEPGGPQSTGSQGVGED